MEEAILETFISGFKMKFLARREIKLLTSFGGCIIFLDNLLLRFKLIFETEA